MVNAALNTNDIVDRAEVLATRLAGADETGVLAEAQLFAVPTIGILSQQILAAIQAAMLKLEPHTALHQQVMAGIAVTIAEQMSFSGVELRRLEIACLLHDVGKADDQVSEAVSFNGKLNDDQWQHMKLHPQIGEEVLKIFGVPSNLRNVTQNHHESLNGAGYPHGKKGAEIDLATRIATVADVVEAMLATRSYKQAKSIGEALTVLVEGRGEKFDPQVVDQFVAMCAAIGFDVNSTDTFENTQDFLTMLRTQDPQGAPDGAVLGLPVAIAA